MEITNIKNPQWSNVDHTMIDVTATFSDLPESEVRFTASPADTAVYGPDIYQRALNGEFGDIAEFTSA